MIRDVCRSTVLIVDAGKSDARYSGEYLTAEGTNPDPHPDAVRRGLHRILSDSVIETICH